MTNKRTCTAPELTAAGAQWRKSSYSDGAGNNCIEAAHFPNEIAVRDSKAPDGAALLFGRSSWSSFVAAAANDGLTTDPRG